MVEGVQCRLLSQKIKNDLEKISWKKQRINVIGNLRVNSFLLADELVAKRHKVCRVVREEGTSLLSSG